MSYILEALKRAESERNRGEVPGLHAQPASLVPPAEGHRAMGWWVAGSVVLTLSGVLASVWWTRSNSPAVVAPAPVVRGNAVPVAPVPPVPQVPVQVPVHAQVEPPDTPASRLDPAEAPPAGAAFAANPLRPRAVLVPSHAAPEPPVQVVPSRRVQPVVAASVAASSAEERVYAVAELPEQIRSQLPALTVGGATYSENPASRMLILNGQLYHEGDRLPPELTLQQIQLRRAVLSFRGYRYAINY